MMRDRHNLILLQLEGALTKNRLNFIMYIYTYTHIYKNIKSIGLNYHNM